MKQQELVALLALMFAFGAPVPELITVASVACGLVFDAKSVSTEHELHAALTDTSVRHIILEEHIIAESVITINRKGKIILDLHGHNLISCSHGRTGFGFGKNRTAEHLPVIDIQSGNLEITGQGHVMALGAESPAIRIRGAMTAENENYASVAINKQVIINAPNYYGLCVVANGGMAYGASVEFHGTMIARDGIYVSGNIQGLGDNVPAITLQKGSRILVDEHLGVALHAAGYATWELHKAEVAGGTGIIIRSGILELDGASIATAGELSPITEDEPSAIHDTGAIIQIEPGDEQAGPIAINIQGGDYTSTKSYVFAETGAAKNLQTFSIKSGQFAGESGIFYGVAPHGAEGAVTEIAGGTFTSDVTSYLASGRYLEKDNKHHAYTVIDASKSRAEAKLAQAENDLQTGLDLAERFLDSKYSAGDLGEWRARFTPVLAVLKRTRTSVNKLLQGKTSTEKLVAATRSLTKATNNVQAVEDDLRAEVATAVASVEAVDPQDYSNYSYRELKTAATAAGKILLQENPGLEAIYSALLDVEINIDLLEERSPDEANLPLESSFKPVTAKKRKTVAPDLSSLPDPDTAKAASLTTEFQPERALARIALGETMPKLPILKKTNLFDLPPVSTPVIKVDPELETAKQNLRNLLNEVSKLDPAEYVHDRYAAMAQIVSRAGNFLAEPPISATPMIYNDLAYDVEAARQNLVKKIDDPASTALEDAKHNLLEMLDAVKDLQVNDYQESLVEQFGELQVAIAKSEALLSKTIILPSEIVAAMGEITAAVSGLRAEDIPETEAMQTEIAESETSTSENADIDQIEQVLTAEVEHSAADVPADFVETALPDNAVDLETPTAAVDWAPLQDVVNDLSKLEASDYTSNSYARVLDCLESAKILLANAGTTQRQIEDAVFDLNLAMLALEPDTAPRLSEYDEFSHNTNYVNIASDYNNYAAAPVMNSVVADNNQYFTPAESTNPDFSDTPIEPNWIMSMMAGAYAGIAAYRRSRMLAKQRRRKS